MVAVSITPPVAPDQPLLAGPETRRPGEGASGSHSTTPLLQPLGTSRSWLERATWRVIFARLRGQEKGRNCNDGFPPRRAADPVWPCSLPPSVMLCDVRLGLLLAWLHANAVAQARAARRLEMSDRLQAGSLRTDHAIRWRPSICMRIKRAQRFPMNLAHVILCQM